MYYTQSHTSQERIFYLMVYLSCVRSNFFLELTTWFSMTPDRLFSW